MLKDVTPGGGLYIIWFSDTHFYGGRAKSFQGRWNGHLSSLRRGVHYNTHMQRVFNIHHKFEPEILSKSDSPEESILLEQRWLDAHWGKPGCMNKGRSARGRFPPPSQMKRYGRPPGWEHSEETKKRLSASAVKRSQEHPLTEQERENLAMIQTGRICGEQRQPKFVGFQR